MGWGGKLLQVGILKRWYLSQALKDEKTLITQSEGQRVLNSKNSLCKGPGVRLHLRMGLNVRQLCHWSEFLFYVLIYIFHFSSLDILISSVIKAGTKSVSTFSQVTSAPDSLRRWSQCSFLLSPSFSLWSHTSFFLVFVYQLIAQLVKNLPVMQETPVPFLGGEDPLEKG